MTELEASGVGEHPPPYMIFLVVFLFFVTGLLGFLICHLLKKKGYRCRTGDMDDEEEEEEKMGGNVDDEEEDNQDTVEQILKCIIENEANMEAFNEMLGKHNICAHHDPRLRKDSTGGVPPHLHTVHSGTDLNSCHLCAQVRSKKGRRQSRTLRLKQRAGEQTVFSVGRFRVTHTDRKLHGGTNPLVSSGDQLDQSQDSEERKEGGYNLRSMFKDARPSAEITNGVAPNVGKRRKSVTIFGLRRGSDPVGIKRTEGTGKDPGGVRFTVQQQPVVLEEPVHTDNKETIPECGIKLEPEIKHSQNRSPVPPQHEAKAVSSVNFTSPHSEKQAHDSSSAPEDGPKHGPEPCTNLMVKTFIGSMATSVPSSLLIPSPTRSGQTLNTAKKQEDVKDMVLKNDEVYDPGPLQTSTPIVPIPGSVPGFASVILPVQHEPSSFPVTQTPPDLSSSLDLEPGFGSLALISLGSSPPTSFAIKSPSSASLLKTPTSPLTATSSPKLSSTNTPSEASKAAFSPALTPSPKLLSGRVMSNQSPIPGSSFGKSDCPLQAQTPSPTLSASPKPNTMPLSLQTPSSSPGDQNTSFRSSSQVNLKPESVVTKGDMALSPLTLKDQELDPRVQKREQKTETKRLGIHKIAKLSPVEVDLKVSSSSDQLSADRFSSLCLSPSSPLSSSSPIGIRISSTTMVKASPDSKREFSVVTMVEDEEASTSMKDQKGETSDPVGECEKMGFSPAVGQRGEVSALRTAQSESQREETSEAEGRLVLHQEKCDMMEMEDIRDCKVTHVQEADKVKEEVKKMLHSQLKKD